jgi:hypothetical protein
MNSRTWMDDIFSLDNGDMDVRRVALPVRKHLDWLHAGLPGWSTVMLYDDRNKEKGFQRCLWAEAADTLALSRMAVQAAKANVQGGYSIHVGIGLRKANLGPYRRGARDDVLLLPALWLEIDNAPLDETLAKFPFTPSMILQSSAREPWGGYHVYFKLREPVAPSPQLERAMDFLSQKLAADTAAITWDSTLRLMGSINRKPSRNNHRVINAKPPQHDLCYDVSAFLAYDPGPPAPPPRRTLLTDERNDSFISAREIAESLNARSHGHYWMASCPVPTHGGGKGDRSPSLQISERADGSVGLYCHGKCAFEDIVKALGIEARNLYPVQRVNARRNPDEAWNAVRRNRTSKDRK